MTTKRVSATQFARNLSSIMNEVRYRDLCVEVVRGKEVIARVIPPIRPHGFPVERLNALVTALPKLDEEEAEEFLKDLHALDSTLSAQADPWGS
jgi:hypothetical protein